MSLLSWKQFMIYEDMVPDWIYEIMVSDLIYEYVAIENDL